MSNVIPFKPPNSNCTDWLQLHVELAWIEPKIWRRILLPESVKLGQLHRIIQRVFGWTDSHLHEFNFDGERFGVPDPDFDDIPIRSERQIQIKTALKQLRSFSYTYDFGDNWEHIITVERRIPGDDLVGQKIVCLAGENATPPEDVGGAPGYFEFCRVMADRSDPAHRDMKAWLGTSFDPKHFDLGRAIRLLEKVKVPK